MAFDFDAYLASRDSANQKLQSVMEASKTKVAELQAFNATKPQPEDSSWTKQLGLEPGSFIGNRVNDLASLASGASRLVGQVVSLPVSIDGGIASIGVSQQHVDAYNRRNSGVVTPEDLQLLEQRVGPSGLKASDALQYSSEQRSTARAINNATDISGIVDQTNRQGLSTDLAQGFGENWGKVTSGETGKVVSGLAGLLVNAGSAIVNNPSAVREYIIENAPQLLVGALGKVGQGVMAASNVGYAVDEFNKGMQAELQRTGNLPSLERQQEMAMQAASLALAEQAGDLIGLRAAGAIGKTGAKTSLTNVGKAVGEGVLSEAPTEGFQTYMEGQIKGKPATPGEIYEAAVIGGASGGGLSGGGRAVAELAKATPEYAAERADTLKQTMGKEAAIQSGDVSSMLDPKSKSYSPADAIAALIGNSQLETSDDAKKASNLKQADEILVDLNKQRQALAVVAMGTEQKQAHIDKMKAALAKVGPADVEGIQTYQEEIDASEKELANIDIKATKDAQQKLARMDAELASARQNREELGRVMSSQESIDASVSVLKDASKAAEHPAAADKIITLAMEAPDRMDPRLAGELAADESNGLSPEQRNYLRSFDESRLAANALMSLGDVSKAIYLGFTKSNGQHDVGIAEYRSNIASAMASGNRRYALTQLTALQAFASDHAGKAAAYQEALAVKPGTQIHKVKGGGWVVATGAQAFKGTAAEIDAQLRKNGGLRATSSKFAADVVVESDALNKAATEMTQAIALKFNKTAVAKAGAQPKAAATQAPIKPTETPVATGATDVKDTSQQGSGTTEKPKAPVVQDAAPAGKSSDAGKTGTVSNTGAGSWALDNSKAVVEGIRKSNPKLLTQIEDLHAQDKVASEIAQQLGISEELVRDLRNGLGLPSQGKESGSIAMGAIPGDAEERAVFLKWRDARKTAEPKTPAVPPARDTQMRGTSGSSESNTVVDSQSKSTESSSESSVDNQSTSEITTESEVTEELATDEVVPAEESPEATSGLKVLVTGKETNKQFEGKKLGEVFTQINKAAAWLTQRGSMPLVKTADLLSRWNTGEHPALNKFHEVALNWGQGIANNFIKGSLPNPRTKNTVREDQLFRDPIQDFVNKDGSVDENVITAVAYAAFSWFNDSARTKRMSKEDILNMHGMGESDGIVTSQGWAALNQMSAMKDTAINTMGDTVIKALGLKASQDAPVNYLSTLSTAFGMHALRVLEREGLVETGYHHGDDVMKFIDGYEIAPSGSKKETVRSDAGVMEEVTVQLYPKLYYVSLKRNKSTLELSTKQGREIQESHQGSGGVVDKFITGEHPAAEASIKPIPFNQDLAKRTAQEVSTEQRAQIEEQQAIPHTVIPAMWNAVKVLGREAYLMAAGWKPYNEAEIQKENRDAVQERNENLEGQFDRMVTLVEGHPEGQEFFVNNVIWQNVRVGVSTQNLNMQSSKIHRGTFGRPGWESEIQMDDEATMTMYLVGLAQSLGIKVDKRRNTKTVEELKALLADPESRFAELAAKLHNSTPDGDLLSAEEKREIGELSASKEGMLTLQGLVSLGDYLAALASGAESFKTTLMVGVDGKTNGPIMAHIMLGAGNSVDELFEVLNKGGMYREADGVVNYNHWKEDARHQDLYESLTKSLMSQIDQTSEEMQAIYTVTKQLIDDMGNVASAGRNLAKTPSTSFFFGSSVQKSIQNMQESFLQAIFDRIEALSAGQAKDIDVGQLVSAINYLIRDPKHTIPVNTSVGVLMGMSFSKQQKTLLAEAFGTILGPWVEKTMEEEYATFIERRNAVNGQIQASFGIYEAIYTDLRNQEMNRLMDEGEMAFTVVGEAKPNSAGKIDPRQVAERAKYKHLGFRKPLHDMTGAQEKALREQVKDVLPVVHTAYSQNDGNIGAGLYMAKSSRSMGKESFHDVTASMGQQFINADDNEAVQMSARAMQRTESSPGVAGLPWMTHSTDSAVMGRSTKGSTTLNVFDEAANGAHKTNETAEAINRSLWDTLLEYSPTEQAYRLLEKTILNAVKLGESGALSQESLAQIGDTLRQALPRNWKRKERMAIPTSDLAKIVLTQARMAWFKAEEIRLGALSQMTSVDQYTWEGGEYKVDEKERGKAKKMLDAHLEQNDHLSDEVKKAAVALGKLLSSATEADISGTTLRKAPAGRKGEADMSNESAAASKSASKGGATEGFAPRANPESAADASPFGALGKSSRNSPEIAAFFEANPKSNAKAVIKFLFEHLATHPEAPNRDYSAKLLRKLQAILPANLPIEMITSSTALSDVIGKHDKPVYGWYVPPQGSKTEQAIYVMGPEFEVSALKFEMLLHEMVHAATHIKLHSSQGKVYQAELQALLEEARKFVAKENLTGYDTKLSSVDELIAYGMTNQKFQQEVLAKVQFTSTITKTNTSALKAFVTTLSRLLGFNTTAEANGLGALMANVAGILAISDEQTSKSKTRTLGMESGVNNYNTLDVLDALSDGSVTPTFQQHLRGVLKSVVDMLHGPFGSLKAELMQNASGTPMDVWNKALATGKAPFASTILASPFKVSNQEAFAIEQVEATVLSALNASEARTKMAYRELTELYQEVYRSTKVQDFHNGDWSTATADEKQTATDLYDFVFKIEKNDGDRSNYLARFAALGLAHQGFNKVLKRATERSGRKASGAKSFADRLQELFEDILGFFRSRVTKTYAGQNADVKLRTLVEQLVDIEQKSRMRLATEKAKSSLAESLEQSLTKANDAVGNAVQKMVNSAFIRKNRSGMVQGAGAAARTAIAGRVDQMLDLLGKVRDEHLNKRNGMLASLISEAKGPNEQMKFALLGAKHNETMRKRVIDSASSTALGEFTDKGEKLTPEQKAAVSQAFLRSGAHALLGSFTTAQIEDLVSDPAKLAAAIAQHEGQLQGNAKGYWMAQARALGYYKATGKVTSQILLTNAGNIARMLGTKYVGKVSDDKVAAAEATLHPLVSLYALSYLSPTVLENATTVLKTENARTDGNGVEFVLKLHQRLEKESQDRLFQSSPELMMHGYTPEILNPNTEVQIADAVDGKELEDRGWSKGGEVPKDPADPDHVRRYMYVLRGAGLGARQTGIVSWLNLNSKGTKKHSGYLNPANANGLANAQLNAAVLAARQAAVQKMFTTGATFDPTKVGTTYMAPVINPAGDITTWRYMMQEQTKDALLERDNRFEHILGALAGSIFDKETSVEQNRKAMQLLKDQFDTEFSKESKRYIEISATSPHKELREIWALFPDSARKDIRKIWGRDSIYVRKDSVDIVFGYRKLSVATMFHDSLDARKALADQGMSARIQDLDDEEFNTLEKLSIMTVETLLTVHGRIKGMSQKDAEDYSKRAAVVMTRAGRMWSEVVAETKDLIVVKTGVVLLDNIWSNISMLVLSGVPIKDILHHHMVALKGATAYHADMDELEKLRLLQSSGHTMGRDKEIQREITRLEDSIARNPITKLVDAGLMPTIVEDIANEDDIYSYKSALVKKADGITSRMPTQIVSAAKTIYMTHDTPLYQGLSRVTQLSDFVARYTMYQHLTTRKVEPMTEKDALSRSIDSFIMYDVPMHPLLQYADDTGLFMFTKYFLRIQRVLRTLYHENPARVAAGLMLDNTMGLGPIVLDSAAMFRIGNPLDVGAFKIFGSLGELATVKPVISLFGGGRAW